MPMPTLILLLLFFLSGASGLVYEVLWTRELALVFGVTTYAVSTVLATYMGGLALGSYLVGRRVEKLRNPLRAYAALEAGIGLFALAVPLLLDALKPLYVELARLGLSFPAFALGRSLLAAAVLLVPTTIMGATFPVLVRHWTDSGRGLRRGTGALYFANTAGAIVGCALAGFHLVETYGLTGTSRIAAATNLALALVAAGLSRDANASLRRDHEAQAGAGEAPLAPYVAFVVLACAGLSGFVSLVAEVLWSRALLRYLYNSTYAFTAMLTAFLLGIAIGSAVYTTLLAQRRRPLVVLAALQVATAAGFALTIWLFPSLPDFSAWWFGTTVVDSFDTSLRMMMWKAMVVLLPPVVSLGAMFPLATALYAAGRRDVGHAVGRVYAGNTLGAILGSVGCAFVLIPGIGMWNTQKLLVALCLLSSGVVLAVSLEGAAKRFLAMAASVAAVLVAFAIAPEDVFRSTFLQGKGSQMDFYREGSTDTVAVQSYVGQRTIVYEDQRGTASTASYGVNLFLGHLPMLLDPGTPRRVLHICFGVGNSLSAVASHQELERVDNVELSPHVLEAGRLFWSNDQVLDHPKVRTIIDDGRNYLMTTSETYDVILLEPPETFTAGVVNLYTTEFYREALEHLSPDGLMMQWIPVANGSVEDEKSLFRAFFDVFPHATMWWQASGGCALLVGTKQPLRIDYTRLKQRFAEPRVKQDMELTQVRDVDHFLSNFVFDEAAFADFVKDASPTRDDHTVLDFTMPRYAGSGFGLGQFTHTSQEGGETMKTPFYFVHHRQLLYQSMARSVLPLLTNLGSDTPEQVGARIEASRTLPVYARFFSEAEWVRMRATGAMPERWNLPGQQNLLLGSGLAPLVPPPAARH